MDFTGPSCLGFKQKLLEWIPQGGPILVLGILQAH
jgi:hypothetical protein